jgi:hypothetical protein
MNVRNRLNADTSSRRFSGPINGTVSAFANPHRKRPSQNEYAQRQSRSGTDEHEERHRHRNYEGRVEDTLPVGRQVALPDPTEPDFASLIVQFCHEIISPAGAAEARA